jgi:hypothetical protein
MRCSSQLLAGLGEKKLLSSQIAYQLKVVDVLSSEVQQN